MWGISAGRPVGTKKILDHETKKNEKSLTNDLKKISEYHESQKKSSQNIDEYSIFFSYSSIEFNSYKLYMPMQKT